MAKKETSHTKLGISILRGINEARAYARGEANGVQAKTFRVPQTNARKTRLHDFKIHALKDLQ